MSKLDDLSLPVGLASPDRFGHENKTRLSKSQTRHALYATLLSETLLARCCRHPIVVCVLS